MEESNHESTLVQVLGNTAKSSAAEDFRREFLALSQPPSTSSAADDFRREFLALARAPSSDQDTSDKSTAIDPLLTSLDPDVPNLPLESCPVEGLSLINSPNYHKTPEPCDYCAARHLECYFICSGGAPMLSCAPCKSLFRPCSLGATGSKQSSLTRFGHLDTLHIVPEDDVQHRGELTGTKPLFTTGASFHDIIDDINQRRPDKAVTRFCRTTTKIMKDWLRDHSDNPYPTDEEKDMLKEQTGLTRSQISNWLANARRRSKLRSRRNDSPPVEWLHGTEPIKIGSSGEQEHMTPLERWKDSPPEHEPAPFTAIARAVANTDFPDQDSGGSSQAQSLTGVKSSSGENISMRRAPSSTSLETGRSSGSRGSLGSGRYSHGSRSSFGSFSKKDHRRRRRTIPAVTKPTATVEPKARRFHCTFCTDTFVTKYDWTRHEKSLHLSLEQWICAPQGPVVRSNTGSDPICVYCRHPNPDKEHLATHNHSACEDKGPAARTFYRKDHLRQHLRLVHGVNLHPSMESWKSTLDEVRSRCGLCPPENPTTFTSWRERADHLSKHFNSGATMASWRGEHGFDPEIAAMVSHAMPPYMIAMDSRTPMPFSATQRGSWASTWDEPTRMLGRWVRQKQSQNETVSDDMLKQQARLIMYGDTDEWNTSRADNPEWLTAFKRTYGLFTTEVPPTNKNSVMANGGAKEDTTMLDDPSSGDPLNLSQTGPQQPTISSQTLSQLSNPSLWSSLNYALDTHPQPSCYQLEAMELSAYIERKKAQGCLLITDQELQNHARQMMYDTTEAWDITAADNPEWLRGLRMAHGILDEGPEGLLPLQNEQQQGASSLPTPLEDIDMSFPDDSMPVDGLSGSNTLPEGFVPELDDGLWDPNLSLELDEGLFDLSLENHESVSAGAAGDNGGDMGID